MSCLRYDAVPSAFLFLTRVFSGFRTCSIAERLSIAASSGREKGLFRVTVLAERLRTTSFVLLGRTGSVSFALQQEYISKRVLRVGLEIKLLLPVVTDGR